MPQACFRSPCRSSASSAPSPTTKWEPIQIFGHPPREHPGGIPRVPMRHARALFYRLHRLCPGHVPAACHCNRCAVFRLQRRGAADRHPARNRPAASAHGLHRQVLHPARHRIDRRVFRRVLPYARPQYGHYRHDGRRADRVRGIRHAQDAHIRADRTAPHAQEGLLLSENVASRRHRIGVGLQARSSPFPSNTSPSSAAMRRSASIRRSPRRRSWYRWARPICTGRCSTSSPSISSTAIAKVS